jgi:type IX secretion system PorP/SprF family membrane protein
MKIFITLFILVADCLLVQSQSYNFSQLFSTPLLNNPAFTGYINGPYRVAANFRSQWAQGSSPYLTGSLSGDFSLLHNRLPQGDKLGVGVSLMNDQSLGGALQTNTAGISLAYHLQLDGEGTHHVGVGFQGAYYQRRIDYTKLTFENQFTANGFNPNAGIGEPLNNINKNFMDANAGILYNYTADAQSFFVSVAGYNLLQHTENMQADQFKQPFRLSLLGGGQVNVGYAGICYFSVNHQRQAGANTTTVGGSYGVQIGQEKEQEFDFGAWYRIKDAVIPYIGYRLNGFQAGLSYDYTVSGLKTGSQVRNAFELSIIIQGADKTELKRLVPWY